MTVAITEHVPVDGLPATVRGLRHDGFALLDVYTGVDHGDVIELVLRLSRPDGPDAVMVTTRIDALDPVVASLVPVLPAAAWQERELGEMFGITFVGHPDPRPLLLRGPAVAPPLRRRVPLPSRVARPWPGAETGGERRRSRRQLPPGVRDEWLAGRPE